MIKSIKYKVSSIKEWVRENKKEAIILGVILLIGAVCRLYKIANYMTFLGDEGRDAIVVRRLLVNFDPILIGPGTSIGNMYLGPLYYYMMAPALLLANFSPVGPSVMIALLGVATIFLVWYIARLWFGKKAALISSSLYAISPVIIIYSRSSWNPNIMPFFALICIFSLWKIFYEFNFKWVIVLGISYAFVLQSHYLGLLLAPTIAILWILTYLKITYLRRQEKLKNRIGKFVKYSLISFLIFCVLMSPLVIFDARHGWRNFSAIATFFSQRETTVSIKPWKAIPNIWPVFKDDFITRIVAANNSWIGNYTSIFLVATAAFYLLFNYTKINKLWTVYDDNEKDEMKFFSGIFLLFIWILVGIIGLGLYKQHIYDHYFGFVFAAPFLFLGAILGKIWEKFGDDGKIFVSFSVIILVVANIIANPLRYPANSQMWRAIEVAKVIQREAGGVKFNLAVIAKQNYEDGYQYFLEKWGEPVYDIDPLNLDKTIAGQLFVVCELPRDQCDPTHSPKAEIANFGWSKIDGEWDTVGVFVYKLVHTE
jgi:4-amino-4-deoxy-L-arabinose transferase-like glycosyltransferase